MANIAHLYKISDVERNKFYIGKHLGETQNGYWGSGIRLRRHIRKYGMQSLKYEVLVIGDESYIYDMEKAYIDAEFLKSNTNCLNMANGGIGGNLGGIPHNKGKSTPIEVRIKQSMAKKGRISVRKGAILSDETKKKISIAKQGFKHSQETKAKMTSSRTGLKQRQIECPHCHTVGGAATMPRWHFDNCRNKEST